MTGNYTGIEKYDLLIDSALKPLINDKRITGIAIAGSVATGEFTPFSDFDIILLHDKEHEEALKNELPDIAKSIPDFMIGDCVSVKIGSRFRWGGIRSFIKICLTDFKNSGGEYPLTFEKSEIFRLLQQKFSIFVLINE